MTIFSEMVNSRLASWLEQEIAALEEEGECAAATFFSAANHVLNPKDFNRLLAAAKTEARRLRKKAHGCPSRIHDWRNHFTE